MEWDLGVAAELMDLDRGLDSSRSCPLQDNSWHREVMEIRMPRFVFTDAGEPL